MNTFTQKHDFPLTFFYKGWQIKIYKEDSNQSVSKLNIKAEIKPSQPFLEHELETCLMNRDCQFKQNPVFLEDTNTISHDRDENQDKYKQIRPLVSEFCRDRYNYTFECSLNENATELAMGNTFNAIDKLKNIAISYIDNNLCNIKKEFHNFVHTIQEVN